MTREYSESEIVMAFAKTARPVILHYFSPNCCIAATRIAMECLSRFRVPAEPVPVAFAVIADAQKFGYVSGLRGEEKTRVQREAANFLDDVGGGWDGHVVAVAKGQHSRYIIDPSFDQCSTPSLGVTVPPFTLVAALPDDVGTLTFHADLELVTDEGTSLRVQYSPLEDWTFVGYPAWETDHLQPVVAEITYLMSEALE